MTTKIETIRKASFKVGLIIAIVIFSIIALITTFAVMAHISSLRVSNAEYDYLRELAFNLTKDGDFDVSRLSELDKEMLQINPDYICWLRIDGTSIDHPVARGDDNEKYLTTTFQGNYNVAGTLFMDYRNVGEFATYIAGESLPHIIIYGHNTQEGGMFSDLHKYRSESFLEKNKIITLIIHDKEVQFEIFSARMSDINDPAYFLNFNSPRAFYGFADRINAPLAATQILTLSTCVSAGIDEERFIVQGWRISD